MSNNTALPAVEKRVQAVKSEQGPASSISQPDKKDHGHMAGSKTAEAKK